MSKWTTDKEGFIEALDNNEYAEFELDEHHTLITDMDSQPYVHVRDEYYQGHEKIEELLEDNILDIFTWTNGEVYSQQNSTFYGFFGIRYVY